MKIMDCNFILNVMGLVRGIDPQEVEAIRNAVRDQLDKTINQKIVEQNKLKLKNKKEREFLFYYETDIKQFIFQFRRIYYNLKNTFLVVNLS